jgi:hypothetical protein
MSDPHLPAEMLDHIVDHLHDTEDALRNCCLVSKSWIPRSRKHLFANIVFLTVETLQSWKEMFPDPSTSPACYTKSLLVDCSQVVTAADAESGGWITGFSRVEHLMLDSQGLLSDSSSLVPFHGFSPTLKSLDISFPLHPSLWIIKLIVSFPFLEDLVVSVLYANDDDDAYELLPATQPSRLPMFTGSLEVNILGGMESFTRRLLSLPGGIHFQKLTLTYFREEHIPSVVALVEGCSYSLESLDIYDARGTHVRHLRPRP